MLVLWELLGHLTREGKCMKTQTMQFAVQKKDGVIENVGRSSVLTPKTNFNGKGIKWFDDSKLLKKKVNHIRK